MLLYRLGKAKYAHKLDGGGARDNPGRWNSLGNALIYTAVSSGYFGHTVPPVSEHTVPLSKGNFRGSGSM